MGRRIGGLVIVLALTSAASAQAQPSDAPLQKEGVALRRAHRDAEALAVFERALALDGSARTRAQVALAEQALALWVEAERDLSSALAAGREPWFQEHGDDLKAALDAIRSRLGTLELTSNVGGTEIWINGRQDTDWPSSSDVRVAAGDVLIEARASGFVTQARTLHVAAGERVIVAFQLVQGTPAGGPVASTATESTRPSEGPVPATSAMARRAGPGDLVRPAAIASLVGGLVLTAGGSVAFAVRDSNAAIYNDDGRCFYGGLTRDQRCGSYRTAASTAGDLAIVQFGLAAAGLVASGVLFGMAAKTHVPVVGRATCSVGMEILCVAPF